MKQGGIRDVSRPRNIDKKREALRQALNRLLETATERQLDIILAFLETLRAHPDY